MNYLMNERLWKVRTNHTQEFSRPRQQTTKHMMSLFKHRTLEGEQGNKRPSWCCFELKTTRRLVCRILLNLKKQLFLHPSLSPLVDSGGLLCLLEGNYCHNASALLVMDRLDEWMGPKKTRNENIYISQRRAIKAAKYFSSPIKDEKKEMNCFTKSYFSTGNKNSTAEHCTHS